MRDKSNNSAVDFLAHWCRLSEVQQRALLALAREMETASSLVENSMEGLSSRFLELAQIAQNQSNRIQAFSEEHADSGIAATTVPLSVFMTSLLDDFDSAVAKGDIDRVRTKMQEMIAKSHKVETALAQSENECTELTKAIEDIVTKIQFQDRTSQRLSTIGDAIKSVSAMMKEMEDETLENVEISPQKDEEDIWIKELVAKIQLGEVRERFIKHALFDKCDDLFTDTEENSSEVDHSEASDDIELF
ncbi:hypothetical protein RYZ26_03750 [Terasakiella sp. A23]|uniref:hypothetical protein n=1 Tax=Terasakiella sp. FCG-A23 TaxID=3080561 RepID=UPI00295347EB|nr:hypothetical protein [Terasakiella sp. A23]MDV7338697.1 hypothetical protein [Terasakiella sp. A23]